MEFRDKNIASLLMALTMTGCATSEKIYLPSGKVGYSITCGGTDLGWQDCYRKAGETCQSRGYEIVDRKEESRVSGSSTQFGTIVGTQTSRMMVITCKG